VVTTDTGTARELLGRALAAGVTFELKGEAVRLRAARRPPDRLLAELRAQWGTIRRLPLARDYERRFGQAHAGLFAWLGAEVDTPLGRGRLVQVGAEYCAVVIADRAAFVTTAEVRPAQ
jgi:hypothetical protein